MFTKIKWVMINLLVISLFFPTLAYSDTILGLHSLKSENKPNMYIRHFFLLVLLPNYRMMKPIGKMPHSELLKVWLILSATLLKRSTIPRLHYRVIF
jgi:hypothetical protein